MVHSALFVVLVVEALGFKLIIPFVDLQNVFIQNMSDFIVAGNNFYKLPWMNCGEEMS